MVEKNNVKHILKSIRKAFEMSESVKEYEDLCQCIYFSDCKFDYDTFLKLKKLVL